MLATNHTPDTPAPVRPDACPVETWLGFLGHRWTALILWHLQEGQRRYSDLLAQLPGMTAKVLQERLVALTGAGLVERHAEAGFPTTVRYGLTTKGLGLIEILNQFEAWSRRETQSDTTFPA